MSALRHRFAEFVLDPANRTLHRDGEALSLNSRYFDALVLLVREQGRLVGKQRLFDEVWAGSVVTDSALTQCIKEIRRVLGDDAAAPRFIGTVAGHGYRFLATVSAEPAESAAPPASLPPPSPPAAAPSAAALAGLPDCIAQALWPASGGAMAGVLGGLMYGSLLALAPQAQGVGTLSVLLVMLALSALVGMAGALGLGLGMAIGRRFPGGAAGLLGGAAVGGGWWSAGWSSCWPPMPSRCWSDGRLPGSPVASKAPRSAWHSPRPCCWGETSARRARTVRSCWRRWPPASSVACCPCWAAA